MCQLQKNTNNQYTYTKDFLKVLNCDLVPVLDNKSALIFCINVAFSLLSASVPHVVPNVPMWFSLKAPRLLTTVADTSNPAEIKAPDVFLEFGFSSKYISLGGLLYFLFGSL